MISDIWECNEGHVHVTGNGIEMQFKDIDEFLEALLIWQEYVLWRKTTTGPIPEEFWRVFSEESKN